MVSNFMIRPLAKSWNRHSENNNIRSFENEIRLGIMVAIVGCFYLKQEAPWATMTREHSEDYIALHCKKVH